MTRDKIFHFLAGGGIALGVTAPLLYLTNENFAVVVGTCIAAFVGLIKEVIDRHDGGVFDVRDLVATIIGGGWGATLAWLISILIRS